MELGSSPAYLAVMSAAGVLVMRPLVGWTGRSESDCTATGDGACYQVRVLCDEHADGEERNATWVSWGTVTGVEAVKEAEERLGSVKDADLAACDRRVDGPEAGSGGSVRSILLLPPFLAEGSSWDSCSLKLYLLEAPEPSLFSSENRDTMPPCPASRLCTSSPKASDVSPYSLIWPDSFQARGPAFQSSCSIRCKQTVSSNL